MLVLVGAAGRAAGAGEARSATNKQKYANKDDKEKNGRDEDTEAKFHCLLTIRNGIRGR